MSKIIFGAFGASVVLMTACTDYVADIEESHNGYVAAKQGSSVTSSSCVCNLQESNLLRDNFGNLYYDYSILGDGDIYWKVDGCNAEYFFLATMAETGGGSFVYQDKGYGTSAEFPARVTTGEGGNASIKVDVKKDESTIETLLCPTVEVRGVNYGESSSVSGNNAFSLVADNFSCNGTELWCKNQTYNVKTGFGNGASWWKFTDVGDGGASFITLPAGDINENDVSSLVDYCHGICGSYNLDKGSLGYSPFVGVGFSLYTAKTPVRDINHWGGLCVTYSSDHMMDVKLGLGSADSLVYNYDLTFVTLNASPIGNAMCFPWYKFKQAGWGGNTKITGDEASHQVAEIRFEIQGTSGTVGNFNIIRITEYTGQ